YQLATGKYQPIDYTQAYNYFTLAAQQGLAQAEYSLGMLYLQGRGVTANPVQAKNWLTKAAKQGEISAQFNLALLYTRGDGVKKDNNQACYWY
ncbi:tetratricopeptide repeat protein, partial [Escherichia coli]